MSAARSMFDAPVTPPTAGASDWVLGTLSGSLVTGVSVVALALLGLALLRGHLLLREAVQVVIGCFVLFGASAIAAGLIGGVLGEAADVAPVPVAAAPYRPQVPLPPPTVQYDPYAGATIRQDQRSR